MKIGGWLLAEKRDRRLVAFLAQRLEVTPRTLRNWRQMITAGGAARIGRPRYPESLRQAARRSVSAQLEAQGYPGWRPIAFALPELPVRLVQESVHHIKACRRKNTAAIRAANRITTTVRVREALWTMDGTMAAKRGSPDAQVVKDRGSLAYRAIRTGRAPCEDDVVSILRNTKAITGLPLVLGTDNASIYCSAQAEEYLRQERVVHLRSLPRTPQHNGAAEIAMREAKEAMAVDRADVGRALRIACLAINRNRLRGSKGFKTSAQLDEELDVAYNVVNRKFFYEQCMKRVEKVRQSALPRSMKRRAEREVILATLQEYKLIERTRDGRPYRCENAEIFL